MVNQFWSYFVGRSSDKGCGVMQMVKPFLERKTHKKVMFVFSEDAISQKKIEELFDKEVLESAFGGRNSTGFDYETYAKEMMEDDKKMAELLSSNSGCSQAFHSDHRPECPDGNGSGGGGASEADTPEGWPFYCLFQIEPLHISQSFQSFTSKLIGFVYIYVLLLPTHCKKRVWEGGEESHHTPCRRWGQQAPLRSPGGHGSTGNGRARGGFGSFILVKGRNTGETNPFPARSLGIETVV